MNIQQVFSKTSKLTLLFVEDEEGVRGKTNSMLEDLFARVDTAIDGVDGLDKYKQYYEKTNSFYDLVITDINMPNLDGLSMIEEILKLNQGQEAIVISAYGDYEKLQKIINYGIKSYIKKPIEMNDLFEKLYNCASKIEEKKFAEQNIQKVSKLEKVVNNSNQVFIIFDKNSTVLELYQASSINLFDTDFLIGKNLAQILYSTNKKQEQAFSSCFANLDSKDDKFSQILFTTTLPKEHIIDNTVYALEYSILEDNKFLLILSDETIHYTAKAELMMEKCECKMMLWAALHKNSFLQLKKTYETFLEPFEEALANKEYDFLESKKIYFLETIKGFKRKFDTINMTNSKNSILEFEELYSKNLLDEKLEVDAFRLSFEKSSIKGGFLKDIQRITNELSKVLDIE